MDTEERIASVFLNTSSPERLQMGSLEPKSTDERLKRKIDAENLRELQIRNDLRLLFGRGSIGALYLIILGVLAIVVLMGLGILSVPLPIWVFAPFVTFLGILGAMARWLFNSVK